MHKTNDKHYTAYEANWPQQIVFLMQRDSTTNIGPFSKTKNVYIEILYLRGYHAA